MISVRALRRHYRFPVRVIVLALMVQAIGAMAPAVCTAMTSSDSGDHAALTADRVEGNAHHFEASHSAETEADSCQCSTTPGESDEQEAGSCLMASHCVSPPATMSAANQSCDLIDADAAPSHPDTHPRPVTLAHPTPPPRA